MPRLGVNIDHVASLREARYRGRTDNAGEPDPAQAVHESELGGAACITMHLREDRRHVNDRDLERCRAAARVKFNLEMAATDEMVRIAARTRPHMCTLVPEGRAEVTTEGGLDVASQAARLKDVVAAIHAGGALVSAFIDTDLRQIDASREAGFDACEIHTGPFAAAFARAGGDPTRAELREAIATIERAGERVRSLGMLFNAGHALNYDNVGAIARLPDVHELHIGHAIVSRAIWTGLRAAVRDMVDAINA